MLILSLSSVRLRIHSSKKIYKNSYLLRKKRIKKALCNSKPNQKLLNMKADGLELSKKF